MSAKTVATWIFGILVIAGALYVRKQYKDIEAGEAAPPKPVAAAPAARPQREKEAAAPAATQAPPGVTHWFEGLSFSTDEAAILAKFGAQVQKLEKRQEFATGYVDYVIPEYQLGGVPFEVFFQMNPRTGRLSQVLLRKQSENQPLGSYSADFNTVLGVLTEKHGKPEGKVQGRRDDTFTEDQQWVGGPVTIVLSRSQSVWPSGRNTEMLTVRYFD